MKALPLLIAGMAVSMMFSCRSANISENKTVGSPDGNITVAVEARKGKLYYSVRNGDRILIAKSRLGFRFQNMPDLGDHVKITGSESRFFNETWEQPWGEKRLIENKYDELTVRVKEKKDLKRELNVVFRVYNDGFGFRYEIPRQENIDSFRIMDELTEFVMPEVHNAWWIPAYKERFYESLYRHTPINRMDTVCTPVTIETKEGYFMAIHEANLTDYAAMNLVRLDSTRLKCDLTPWSTGEKVIGKTPFVTPWRTVIVADSPGELITSYMILNLNEPCRIKDVSWITPGKYIGIWWAIHQGLYTWSQGSRRSEEHTSELQSP
jgi:alpha-glucosidase